MRVCVCGLEVLVNNQLSSDHHSLGGVAHHEHGIHEHSLVSCMSNFVRPLPLHFYHAKIIIDEMELNGMK